MLWRKLNADIKAGLWNQDRFIKPLQKIASINRAFSLTHTHPNREWRHGELSVWVAVLIPNTAALGFPWHAPPPSANQAARAEFSGEVPSHPPAPPAWHSRLLGLPVAGFKSALLCLLAISFRSSSSSSRRQASAIGARDKGGLQAAASTIAARQTLGSPLSAPAPDASRRRGRGVPVSTRPLCFLLPPFRLA